MCVREGAHLCLVVVSNWLCLCVGVLFSVWVDSYVVFILVALNPTCNTG